MLSFVLCVEIELALASKNALCDLSFEQVIFLLLTTLTNICDVEELEDNVNKLSKTPLTHLQRKS